MRIKEKIMGGVIVSLFITHTALAGVTDYINKGVSWAKGTDSYKKITNYTTPTYNYIAGTAASVYRGGIDRISAINVRSSLLSLDTLAAKIVVAPTLTRIQVGKVFLKTIILPILPAAAAASENMPVAVNQSNMLPPVFSKQCLEFDFNFFPYDRTPNRTPADGVNVISIEHSVDGNKIQGDPAGPYLNNGTRLNDPNIYNSLYDTLRQESDGAPFCTKLPNGIIFSRGNYDPIVSNYSLPIVDGRNRIISTPASFSAINNSSPMSTSNPISYANNVSSLPAAVDRNQINPASLNDVMGRYYNNGTRQSDHSISNSKYNISINPNSSSVGQGVYTTIIPTPMIRRSAVMESLDGNAFFQAFNGAAATTVPMRYYPSSTGASSDMPVEYRSVQQEMGSLLRSAILHKDEFIPKVVDFNGETYNVKEFVFASKAEGYSEAQSGVRTLDNKFIPAHQINKVVTSVGESYFTLPRTISDAIERTEK